jgi:hypothetical protein
MTSHKSSKKATLPVVNPTHTTVAQPPQIIQQQSGSLWSSVKAGIGMSIGNRIVNSFLGPPTVHHLHESPTGASAVGSVATQDMTGQNQYMQCMKEGGTEDVCKQHLA